MTTRIDWPDVPAGARRAVEALDPIVHAQTVTAGLNSAVAAVLHTATGRVFVKGLRVTDPGVATQQREAAVNPYVHHLSPRLLWRVRAEGWDFLGFEYIEGRHAEWAPDSPDVALVIDVIRRLAHVRCPASGAQLLRAEQRWAEFLDDPSFLTGTTLLHTDYNPENVLVTGGAARLVDWAWPTLGAAWIDPCCLVVRLIAAGHTPLSAETWMSQLEVWRAAPRAEVDSFACTLCRMWEQIADQDPAPWKHQMLTAATGWLQHRWHSPE